MVYLICSLVFLYVLFAYIFSRRFRIFMAVREDMLLLMGYIIAFTGLTIWCV